jgi:DivIVA domain-containing protein
VDGATSERIALGSSGRSGILGGIATEQFPTPEGDPHAAGGPSEQVTGSLERLSASDRGRQARIAEVREAGFPIALRGYEREAVDAYVERVQSLISELEASGSPEAAIRRALDQVGEETSSILQRAQQTANEITERSRASADDRIREAEREARMVAADAEERVRELEADYGAIWAERDRLLEQVRDLAERLLGTADDAAERFPTQDEQLAAETGPEETASIPALEASPDPADAGPDYRAEEGPLEEEGEGDAGVRATSPGDTEPAPGSATRDEDRAHSGDAAPMPAAAADEHPSPEDFSSGDEIDFVDSPEEEGVARERPSEVATPEERRPG